MHNSFDKSKGYMPISSGPNMTGFDMGKTSSLMEMMQTGGQTTRGGALLARALQMRSDQDRLDEIRREEAERQKKGGLFGSVASFAGGLLGGAIGGPAGAAIGAGLGKGLGERVGAGKARDYDASGTVFSQQSFRDVDEASEEFNEGMLGRSLLSGAVAGATAGLTPGGGIYGQYNPLTSVGRQGIKANLQGLGVTGYTPTQSFTSFGRAQYAGGASGLAGTGELTLFDKFRRSLFGGRSLYNLEDGGLVGYNMGGYTSGGEGDDDTAEQTGTGIVYTDPEVDTGEGDDDTGEQTGTGTSSTNVPFIGSSLTAEGILEQQGLGATPEQLALFQRFDPTGIQSATQATGESLLGMTGGQGLASAGGGFGSQQIAVSQALGQAQQALEGQIEAEQRGFESQTLATAADIIGGGGEFSVAESVPEQPPTSPPSSSVADSTWIQTGPDGRTYLWTGSQWVRRG